MNFLEGLQQSAVYRCFDDDDDFIA